MIFCMAAGQISQGERLAVLSLIPMLKSKGSCRHSSQGASQWCHPAVSSVIWLTLYPHSSPLGPEWNSTPCAFCCSPKASIIISILQIKDWAQEEEMCPGSLIFRAENSSSKHSLERRLLSPTRLTSSKPETFWLTIKVWKLNILSKSIWWTQKKRPEQNTHDKCCCHHHYSKDYDFLYSCLKAKQNLPAKLVWTTLQSLSLRKNMDSQFPLNVKWILILKL